MIYLSTVATTVLGYRPTYYGPKRSLAWKMIKERIKSLGSRNLRNGCGAAPWKLKGEWTPIRFSVHFFFSQKLVALRSWSCPYLYWWDFLYSVCVVLVIASTGAPQWIINCQWREGMCRGVLWSLCSERPSPPLSLTFVDFIRFLSIKRAPLP